MQWPHIDCLRTIPGESNLSYYYWLMMNGVRYGTTTYILPPFKVLHTSVMENDPLKIREAVAAEDHPMVVVLPKDFSEQEGQEKKVLKEAGLWQL